MSHENNAQVQPNIIYDWTPDNASAWMQDIDIIVDKDTTPDEAAMYLRNFQGIMERLGIHDESDVERLSMSNIIVDDGK